MQMYLLDLARRCRFLSEHTLDLRLARQLRRLEIELDQKAREARRAADAAAPTAVQRFAPANQASNLSFVEIRAAVNPIQA